MSTHGGSTDVRSLFTAEEASKSKVDAIVVAKVDGHLSCSHSFVVHRLTYAVSLCRDETSFLLSESI